MIFLAQNVDAVAATDNYEYAFFKMLAMFGLLLVFIVISFWAFRRISRGQMGKMNQNRTIKVIERRPISPKTVLYLIEFSGKQMLIAESQLEVRRLDEKIPEPMRSSVDPSSTATE